MRERLDATALERLRVGALGGIGFGAMGLVFAWVVHPDDASLITLVTVAISALAIATRAAVRRELVPQRWASAVGTLLWSVGLGVVALCYAVTEDSAYTVFAAVMVLAAGMLHLFTRWLVVSLVVLLAIWTPIGLRAIGSAFAMHLVALSAVWVVALMLHVITIRYFVDLERLRIRERAHQQERERLREQLLQAQKLEAVGTLAGGVAHDMNNVLAAIVGVTELLRDELSDCDACRSTNRLHAARDAAEEILGSARRGAELTRNLLGFSRRGDYRRATFELAPMIVSLVTLLRKTLPRTIDLETGDLPRACVVGDPAQLGQAVMNLCVNACDAMDAHGVLRIDGGEVSVDDTTARALEVRPGSYATVVVTDRGCGMSREVQDRAFEPFFTTKPQGHGAGLGLAMVYGTAKRHQGSVTIESEVGRGTVVTLLVPVAARAEASAAVEQAKRSCGAGMVLVVDDDPSVRSANCRHLERAGYEVVSAGDGREALEVFARHALKIDIVVLDMIMPVMGGAECFARLKEIDPDVRVILASGQAREGEVQGCLNEGALTFLEKPFRARQLTDAVAHALSGAARDDRATTPDGASPTASRPTT